MKGKRHMQGICEAIGEIDSSSAPTFRAAMRSAIDQAADRDVIVNCQAVSFMESSAFHALAEAHTYAIEHGHQLVIANLQPNCARVVRMCDIAGELMIDESIADDAPLRASAGSANK